MLLPYLGQQICPSNATYICLLLHVHISNNNMSSLQSIIEQKHWYTYISHYWHTPLNKNVCCITYLCPTGLTLLSTCRPHITTHIIYKKNYKVQPFTYHATAIYVPATNIPLKCHVYAIYQDYLTYTHGGYMQIYMQHINSLA